MIRVNLCLSVGLNIPPTDGHGFSRNYSHWIFPPPWKDLVNKSTDNGQQSLLIVHCKLLIVKASFSVSLFAAKKRKEDKLYDRFKGKKELNRTKKVRTF